VTEAVFTLLSIALVLVVVSLLVPLAERLRQPHTVLLAVVGLALGFLSAWIVSRGYSIGPLGDAFTGLNRLEGATDLYLPLFLPPLVFTAGLTIDVRRLIDEFAAVLLLAVIAVLVCIAGVAAAVRLTTGFDLVVCLFVGAIVSSTDPAAVVGIFRDVGAPKRLSILAEGEALFNDAVAIAAFSYVLDILVERSSPGLVTTMAGAPGPLVHFLRDFAGGIAFGYFMARLAMVVLSRLGDSEDAIASVTVSLAYASYVLADHYLQLSGVITVVAAALTVAAYGPTLLHPRQWTALRQLWGHLEFWSNCLIFILASMAAANVLLGMKWLYVWGVAGVALGAFVARIAVIFGMLPLLETVHLVERIDRRYLSVLVWGGLRGAITLVLAMVAASDLRLPAEVREFSAVLATLFVLFTLLVNATSLGLTLRILGLDKLSRVELAMRDRVLALSRAKVARHVQEIIREHNQRVEGLDVDPASAGEPEIEAPPAELALDLDERVSVGLLTLCARERELYFELFDHQTLSRHMVARLTARADRLIDAVRDRGGAGYRETAHGFALPGRAFRLAVWLHERLGYDKPLSGQLADRFEILMVSQEVLAELAAFNRRSVAELMGSDTAARLEEVIADRQQLVDRALKALSLQYPGYAESVKNRELERAAIRFEAQEYADRLHESAISREVYADLRSELARRRRAASRRPPLDLGGELAAMIARVPLFAALDAAAVREVGRRLHARMAMPGENIIEMGGPPDSMYFVAAGEVTVHVPSGAVMLKEGEFFGEMGLLESKPRNADVVANGYCYLLVLSRRDFDELLEKRPQMRGEIEAVAAQRASEATSV